MDAIRNNSDSDNSRGVTVQFVLILSVLLGWAASIAAQPRGVEAGREAETWAAVGILQAEGGFCSAALIAPDTVLTAAHCVYKGNRLARPENILFRAGWREGISAATRRAVRVVAHRGYDPAGSYDSDAISADLALVTLESPIPTDAAAPFATMDKVRVGEKVASVSFSGRRSDVASINEDCKVKSRKGDILILSCESHPGMSGSPVFANLGGTPRIIALISGSRYGPGGENNGIALAIRQPLTRVEIDRDATRSTPQAALPSWSARSKSARSTAPAAQRKSIRVGSGTSRFGNTVSNPTTGGRKVLTPPKR